MLAVKYSIGRIQFLQSQKGDIEEESTVGTWISLGRGNRLYMNGLKCEYWELSLREKIWRKKAKIKVCLQSYMQS